MEKPQFAYTLVRSTPQKKSIDFLGISCYTKNPGTKKGSKCSTPILGMYVYNIHIRVEGLGFRFRA